jgi:two-component system, sensor histidine kinase and response regulator
VSTPPGSNTKTDVNGELLIVEDEAVTGLYLREHLDRLGYHVIDVVASGEQALHILDQQRADLVLMDIMLAGELSGTQTAKIIDERFQIPIIYLTAYNDDATLKAIETAGGGYGFLTKPIREKDLHPVIGLAISRHKNEVQQRESERSTWEELCRHAQGQLEQFTYAAGHDLKEPLRTARTFIDLLASRSWSRLDSKEQELLTHAQAGLTRMNTLLDDLLGFAQAGLRHGAPVPETPADAALKWALADLRRAIAESDANITYEALPVVRADPSQLAQVFQNLLANAIKYRRSDRAPRIHVAVSDHHSEWLFSIRDNGVGFDSQHAERIFAPFQRLHSQREYPGTGIGLAICSKIVQAHGGRMWAESKPRHGSVFFFTLPRLQA